MLWIDKKYISLIGNGLEHFTNKGNDVWNFRCPYCGDSEKNKRKARGYFLRKGQSYYFFCHNCSATHSIRNFLKDNNTLLYDEYVVEKYVNRYKKHVNVEREVRDVFNNGKTIEIFKGLRKISSLDNDHVAKKYILKRKIPSKFHYMLYYTEKFKTWSNKHGSFFDSVEYDSPRIIIPLMSKCGKYINGVVGRSLNNKNLRYLTLMFDDVPKIFGLDKVNLNKPFYVVEGPFDSMFIDNSIAVCGSTLLSEMRKLKFPENAIFVYDNQPRNRDLCEIISNTIERDQKVIIWPDSIKEKDINDMVIAGIDISVTLHRNVYKGLAAKLAFSKWKKI